MSGVSALLIGCGSIGKRHLRNLKALGVGPLYAFDISPARAAEAVQQTGAKTFTDLEAALATSPTLVIVASPNNLHIEHAILAAKAGSHLFIEKPLSHTLDRVEELCRIVNERELIALVGCNMRFHPGIASLRRLVMEGAIGRVFGATVFSGSYLPDWHPGEDYRKNYSARKDLGGGVILDAIHEIDYILDILGAPDQVFCEAGTFGDLGIETEDTADLSLRLRGGARVSIHLDYLQRVYRRQCRISGTKGTLEWNWEKPVVRLYTAATKTWTEFPCALPDANQLYIDELRHFLNCLAGKARPVQGLTEARLALAVALAAKESAAEDKRRFVSAPRRTVAVIQAGVGSPRMLARVSMAKNINEVILAASDAASDDDAAREAAAGGARVYRGGEADVLDRVYQAARQYGASTIVLLTGDCMLADPALLDRMLTRFEESRVQGLPYAKAEDCFPAGLGVEILTYDALKTAREEAAPPSARSA